MSGEGYTANDFRTHDSGSAIDDEAPPPTSSRDVVSSDRDLFILLFDIPERHQRTVRDGDQDTLPQMLAIARHRMHGGR